MAEFYPRLTADGINGNRLWYADNPFYQNGYGLPNCTCYAWGRFWEIGGGGSDIRPTLSLSDAELWYDYIDGYERSQTPALGSIICYANGPYSGYGHVAVVEEIHDDGSITTSNSGWTRDPELMPSYYFYLSRNLTPPNYLPVSGYVFQGFILNPHGGGKPTGRGKKIWLYKRKLWRIEKNDY